MHIPSFVRASTLSMIAASPLLAQEGAAEGRPPSLLSPEGGLMVWTLVVFIILFVFLSWKVLPAITKAVREREAALAKAIEEAKKDRDEAARILAEHQAKIAAARDEAQKFIADGRATAE